ncbi:STAS domain-containing protein [Oceaniglobus indicus]|uniref:STAS domain-containing protein n=1 Tax=Oceaniglobus indicus TaxID=2047749 RepID=UPI000C17BD24|nr:STAS domain-containing protein [Oceaniglobus indicus]
MQLNTEIDGDLLIVTVGEDRVDAAVALDFKERMRDLTQDAPARVVLDLGHVRFLDSSGLGAVIGAMKQLGSRRRLELAGLNPAVQKVFRLTRMDSIFVIHDDIASARETRGNPPLDTTRSAHAC